MSRGSEFGEVQPLLGRGGLIAVKGPLGLPIRLPDTAFGAGAAIDTAQIFQVTPSNSFRDGQQIIFTLGVKPYDDAGDWANWVRLKLWWAVPNKEFRQPGFTEWLEIDRQTFGNGPVVANPLENNRYVWVPSPKRLDITPWGTAPPPIPPIWNSDSELLDDCLAMYLPDPNDATYQANFPSPQVVSRWVRFYYPAMGYALGMTWDATAGGGGNIPQTLDISLTWRVGTLGGTLYQESIG